MNKHLLPGIALMVVGASRAQAQVKLSEVYSAPSAPSSEFIELEGPGGTVLDGFMVLIVDGATSSSPGTLDRAWDLSGLTIPAACFFTLGESSVSPDFLLSSPDPIPDRSETVYLIHTANPSAITALLGTNVSVGGGATAIPGMSTFVNTIAMTDGTSHTVWDGAQDLGPDVSSFPAGVVTCGDPPFGWNPLFLDFDGVPTAGYVIAQSGIANPPCAPFPGSAYCFGDGSGTACPCGNNGPAGEGCLNSLGSGGRLVASGFASVSQDSVVLSGSQMPSSTALYFQGTVQLAAGSGVVFGDGLRCVGGSVIRLGPELNIGGSSSYPAGADPAISVQGLVSPGDTRNYQCWYRNAAAFCTPSTFNLTNGWTLTWSP